MQLKLYTRYWFPGSFISEDTLKPRDMERPVGAYSWQDVSRYETVDPKGNPMTGQLYIDGPKKIIGVAYTLEQVKKLPGDYHILIGNMERNGWNPVVKCAQGFLPLDPGDVVVAS